MPVSSGQIYHYLLDMDTLGQLSIENGRKFENLLDVVDHYSRTPDGFLRSLGEVCPVNMFPSMESEVRHGPLRIDESEIIVRGDRGMLTLRIVHLQSSDVGTAEAREANNCCLTTSCAHAEPLVSLVSLIQSATTEQALTCYIYGRHYKNWGS